MNIRVCGIHWEKRRITHTEMKGKQCNLLKQFSYDLEMKTSEQNRNNKRVGTAIWLVYRTDTNARGFWLVKRTLGWKNFMPEKSTDTSLWRHSAIRLANLTMPSPYQGFLWRENEEVLFWSFHPLAGKQIANTYRNHYRRLYENRSN